MVNSIVDHEAKRNFSEDMGKLVFALSAVFLSIAGLTIFQDFLQSKRNGHAFYFNESLLFKTIWFLFIPILGVLSEKLKSEKLDSYGKTAAVIVLSILAHFIILPFVAVTFSELFYEGSYSLYKFFSYTLANDFYKLIIVYSGFVLGHKYLSSHTRNIAIAEGVPVLKTIVMNNGKDNVIINVEDILQITSATPYIFVHLKNKKYLHSESLKSISAQLDGKRFIRVHKSTVVNISEVTSFKSRLNGDYDLQLTNGVFVRLSRTYARDFKQCFPYRSSG